MAGQFTLNVFPTDLVPKSPAARTAFIQELIAPPIYCECGCDRIVGYGEPLIDRDLALSLLDKPTE